jgi:hypothetical protein
MPGRLTGNARHLSDPAGKVYYATMEEGLYEVDVRSLAVTQHFPDANDLADHAGPYLPGYHGKGAYSGQGRVVYANNGELSALARTRPDIPSGVLAEWAPGQPWHVVRRNQFTEVTGPGGVAGNDDAAGDPVWSLGWDHRSLLLMLLDGGTWQAFRLPKASHAYDGAHGWNTEWPRIREIGEADLLMTMHGQLWRFPRGFRAGRTAGIAPRSTLLKVTGDFCRWQDQVVFGCDDAARAEFLNTRRAKGPLAGPAQSQSNLWFVPPERLDGLGPVLGRGAVWLDEPVAADQPSDPYLFGGFSQRGAHMTNDAEGPVTFRYEVDRAGDGTWTHLTDVRVGPHGHAWTCFPASEAGSWIRVRLDAASRVTVWFEYRDAARQPAGGPSPFASLALADEPAGAGGLLRAGDRATGLQILARPLGAAPASGAAYHVLGPDLELRPIDAPDKAAWMAEHAALATGVLRIEDRSVLYVDDDGSRYRLPVGNPAYLDHPDRLDGQRAAREVVTERDLFQAAGTFYELPARNAGGFGRIRPIATHPYYIQDFCSWRGLLVLTGIAEGDTPDPHIVRSADGRCAVWLGAVDDLWSLGKPTGTGGPWHDTPVVAGTLSDPYLMAGYDQKTLTLSHDSNRAARFDVEIDLTGTGLWRTLVTIEVPPGAPVDYRFPEGFNAYWVRLRPSIDLRATARFVYR